MIWSGERKGGGHGEVYYSTTFFALLVYMFTNVIFWGTCNLHATQPTHPKCTISQLFARRWVCCSLLSSCHCMVNRDGRWEVQLGSTDTQHTCVSSLLSRDSVRHFQMGVWQSRGSVRKWKETSRLGPAPRPLISQGLVCRSDLTCLSLGFPSCLMGFLWELA